MARYVALLRGINVGGKNKLPMADLRECFEELGCTNVTTYIASGNVLFSSDKPARKLQGLIEAVLPERFTLDSELVRVLVLNPRELSAVASEKPKGFGEQPDEYHSDVVFLMGVSVAKAMAAFNPREGVDTIWPGKGVIYAQRLSAERAKSRLGMITASPHYKSMTIRSWNTVESLWQTLSNKERG